MKLISKKNLIKSAVFVVIIIVALRLALFLLIPSQNIELNSSVWKHRAGIPENTLEGFEQSLVSGFKGIEVDVYKTDKGLLLAHDKKESLTSQTKLIDILKRVKETNINLWIDYKKGSIKENLDFSSEISSLLDKYDLKKKVFIETKDYPTFVFLRINKVPTSFWYQPRTKMSFIFKSLYKFLAQSFKTPLISYDYVNREQMKNELGTIPHMVFTAKTKEELNRICQDKVDVILTSIDFESIPDTCSKKSK